MNRTYQNLAGLLAMSVLIFSPVNASGQQLQLDISLSDSTYYICQPIWLDVQLTNIGGDTARTFGFEFPGGSGFNILLTNESGDTLTPVFLWEFLDCPGFLLNPKEWCYQAFDLSDIFHNYEVVPEFPAFQWTPSLAPGKYEVSAKYHVRNEGLGTDKITFQVIEPTGAEREALELYVEAYKNQKRNKSSLSKQQFDQLVASYPNSVYTERAYVRLSRYDVLLEKCPDSGYLQGYLKTKVDKMSKEEKHTFLDKVIKEHPKTRSAKFADQLLRGW